MIKKLKGFGGFVAIFIKHQRKSQKVEWCCFSARVSRKFRKEREREGEGEGEGEGRGGEGG